VDELPAEEEPTEESELAPLRDEPDVELVVADGARGEPGWTLMDGEVPVAFLTREDNRAPVVVEMADEVLSFELVGVFRRRIRIHDQSGAEWATFGEPGLRPTHVELPGAPRYSLDSGNREEQRGFVLSDPDGREILHAHGWGGRLLVAPSEAPHLLLLTAILSYIADAEVWSG
jgi:hypothetical protein